MTDWFSNLHLHPDFFLSVSTLFSLRTGVEAARQTLVLESMWKGIFKGKCNKWRLINLCPLLGFTKLLPKLLDGSKTQTIRKPRKYPIKEGDKLFIYWKLRTKQCRKLGEGIVTSKIPRCLGDCTIYDIKKDGFESREQFEEVFYKMHPKSTAFMLFDIITWRWTQWEAS